MANPIALLFALVVFACTGISQRTHAQEDRILDVSGGQIRIVTVATGLVHPWSIRFLPNGDLLVTEQPGRLRLIRDDELLSEPVWVSPVERRDALKMVAVHPRFAENGYVYVSYPKLADGNDTLAVARGVLRGNKLEEVEDIFIADAWEEGGNLGGRIDFGPDETLYIAVGDRDRLCCVEYDDNRLRIKAQQLDNHVGKTLRINDDGGIPDDNPFADRNDSGAAVFTYGHRNGYGFAFHPQTGELWQTEIGPMGGDEVNILLPGHNYGWPLVSTGRNYTGTLVSEEPWARPGMDNPRIHWVPSISPSSIMFYTGDKFPEWQNDLFVGALTTRQLQRIAFNQPSQAERRRALLTELDVRVRDVVQSPDGYIYVATELNFLGSDADGTVLRLEPVE
jgi:glucose/arabinose dehydrogenase